MLNLDALELDSLPSQETDDVEYKSSVTAENQLKRKIQNAASAFWNTGGGIFLAGVANDGTVDGGIAKSFGRQTLNDWLSQVLSVVRPNGTYDSRVFEQSDHAAIATDKCVLVIQFLPSAALPHQAPDNKYYIRAGAHTVPASHDIVDALYAKRHVRHPRLVHVTRLSHWTTETDFLHVEVIAATDSVAFDVEIDLAPRPSKGHLIFPIVVPLIDRDHSFSFRFEVRCEPAFSSVINIKYRDLGNETHTYHGPVEASKCVPPWNLESGEIRQVAEELRELKRAIEQKDSGITVV